MNKEVSSLLTLGFSSHGKCLVLFVSDYYLSKHCFAPLIYESIHFAKVYKKLNAL